MAAMANRTTLQALFGILALWAEIVGGEPSIEPEPGGWKVSTPVYISGVAWYFDDGVNSIDFQSLSIAAEFKVASPSSRWQTGLFVDRRFSPDDKADGIVNAGWLLKRAQQSWDTALWIFNHNPPSASSQWVFATRVRYLISSQHKVGLEVFGSFDDAREPDLLFGYYGDVTERLSVRIVAGANVQNRRERVARTELVWQIH